MKERQRIVLYGDTLLLAGVRASLEDGPAFEVIPLDASHATEQDLLALRPAVVIFDNAPFRPQLHYDLIAQQSELLLIGIDPDSSQVLLWFGQQMGKLSVQDLVELICQRRARFELLKTGEE